MSLIYNPKTKKTQPWVLIFFILFPIFLIIIGYIIGLGHAQKYKNTPKQEDKDIFSK